MGSINSTPVKELEKLRKDEKSFVNVTIDKETKFDGVSGNVGEMVLNVDTKVSSQFQIKLRCSATEETVLAYDKATGIFSVNRDKSGQGAGGISQVKISPSDNLKM